MGRGLFFAALLATLTVSASASAWCRATVSCKRGDPCDTDPGSCSDATPVYWPTPTLRYRFSTLAPAFLLREEARAAVREAFHRWSDTICPGVNARTSLRFIEEEDTDQEKPLVAYGQAAVPFGIYFRDIGWPYTGKDNALAQTNTSFLSSSGKLTYADIEINSGSHLFATDEEAPGNDLQAVITHEAGHFIGLAHSKVPSSIMIYDYCGTGAKERCSNGKVAARRLANDDIDALCTLYPPGEKEAEPSGCAMQNTESELPGWGVLALVGLVLGVRARLAQQRNVRIRRR